MNAAYNHGSQGDLTANRLDSADGERIPGRSLAPAGTGDLIRAAALEGDIVKLKGLMAKWEGDPVINEGDVIGTTALHAAASRGHKECVVALLKSGADKKVKNHYGQTAYVKAMGLEVKALVKTDDHGDAWCSIQ